MSTDPEANAYPVVTADGDGNSVIQEHGLTKREHFAALAMQGLASKNNSTHEVETCAQVAVGMADALIAALNKP